jgi:hypothetical protein
VPGRQAGWGRREVEWRRKGMTVEGVARGCRRAEHWPRVPCKTAAAPAASAAAWVRARRARGSGGRRGGAASRQTASPGYEQGCAITKQRCDVKLPTPQTHFTVNSATHSTLTPTRKPTHIQHTCTHNSTHQHLPLHPPTPTPTPNTPHSPALPPCQLRRLRCRSPCRCRVTPLCPLGCRWGAAACAAPRAAAGWGAGRRRAWPAAPAALQRSTAWPDVQ